MPNTLSALPASTYKLSHDPTQSIIGDPSSDLSTNPYAAMTDELIFGAVNELLEDIDAATGLDFVDMVAPLENLLGAEHGLLSGLVGFLDPSSSTVGGGVFGPLLGLIPGIGSSTGTLGGFGSWLNPTSFLSGAAGVLSPIFSTAATFLGSLIPGLDASKITSGSFSLSQLPSTVLNTITGVATGFINGVLNLVNIPNLPAAQITSGSFLGSLIPGLDASKITSGSFSLSQLPATVLSTVSGVASSLISGVLGLVNIPNLPAGQVTSGTFGAGFIPNLDASKITTGSFSLSQLPATVLNTVTGVATSVINGVLALANIPNLPAAQITSGTLGGSLIPALDASKITTGMIPLTRLVSTVLSTVSGVASSLVSGVLALGNIPNLPAGQVTSGTFGAGFIPSLDASKITTGTFPLSQLASTVLSTVSGVATSLLTGTIGASLIPNLDASKVTTGAFSLSQLPTTVLSTVSGVASSLVSGVLALGNIPNLPAAQITSGTIGAAQVPNIDASKVTSGAFTLSQLPTTVLSTVTGVASSLINGLLGLANIPNLPAAQITSGTLGTALIPAIDASKITTGVLGTSQVPNIDASKVTTGAFAVGQIPSLTAAWGGKVDNTVVSGILGPNNVGASAQAIVDYLYQANTGATTTGVSLGQLANATADTSTTADNALLTAQSATAQLANRAAAKVHFDAIDPTADAVFPLSVIQGATPTLVSVNATTSLMGFIGTPDGGLKQSVCWHGGTTANVSTLTLNLYKQNPTTGVLTPIFSSGNIIGLVNNPASGTGWNYYTFPAANFITAGPLDIYAVEMQVTGAGAYQIVGMPNWWLYNNAATVPQSLGAQRSTAVTYDATAKIFGGTANSGSGTITASAGASVIVSVQNQFSGASPVTSWTTRTCTYNGVAMTSLGVVNDNSTSTGDGWVQLFGLIGCATGAADTVAFNSAPASGTLKATLVHANSYKNVASFTNALLGAGSGTAMTTAAQTVPIGGAVVFAGSTQSSTGAVSLTGTNGNARQYNTQANFAAALCDIIVAGAVTPNFTASAANYWGMVSILLNPATVPAQPASPMTPVYANNIPWFGLSGAANVSIHAPAVVATNVAGTYTYNVPAWMMAGNKFDIVICSAGGGSNCGDGGAGQTGNGGTPGAWTAVTLTYGTDIPLGTTAFTVVVGAGGTAGVGTGTAAQRAGGQGQATTVTVPGWGALTIAGGAGGNGFSGVVNGAGPGNETWQGQTYYGGSTQQSTGGVGSSPGGAAAGGSGGFYGGYQQGNVGGAGFASITARQS